MKIIREIFRPQPKALYIEPFFGCNYRCPFCIHGSGQQMRSAQLDPLALERLKPLIEQISHVHITGLGEPFLNPHLPDYLSYFRDHGKSYYITTNGSLLEDAHIELMTGSPNELSVSLDAGDKDTYDKVRPGGSWDRVLSRVKRVSEIKAERKSPYPLLYLTFHVNALNLMSLQSVPEIAQDLRIEAVKLSWTRLPKAYRSHSIFKEQDRTNDVIYGLCKQLTGAGIHVMNEAVFRKHARGCWHFREMAFVGANGAVAACCSRWVTIGNIHDNRFEDIWNGTPRRRIALGIINGSPEPACANCEQIVGVDYQQNEESFLKSPDLDSAILAEKTKSLGILPSLDGLDDAFHAGVTAFLGGNLPAAVNIFSVLETMHPDFFEIKNNLAAAHYYLGNVEKCRELLHMIEGIPHNKRIIQSNLESLSN